jgi:VanZ family protein
MDRGAAKVSMSVTADRFTLAARAVFAAALVFTVVMALLPHPPKLAIDDFGDKFHHILAFATLALLASLAFPAARLTRIGERLSFLGALIEVLQSIPALHRDCDIRDWIADTIAIAVVLVIMAAIRRRHPRQA